MAATATTRWHGTASVAAAAAGVMTTAATLRCSHRRALICAQRQEPGWDTPGATPYRHARQPSQSLSPVRLCHAWRVSPLAAAVAAAAPGTAVKPHAAAAAAAAAAGHRCCLKPAPRPICCMRLLQSHLRMAGNGYMALPGLRDDAVLSPGSPAPPAALAPPPPTEQQADLWHRLTAWPAAHVRLPWRRPAHEPQLPASGYLTLIPLSDSRLQPRDSRITAVFLLGFALVVAAAVFCGSAARRVCGRHQRAHDAHELEHNEGELGLAARARVGCVRSARPHRPTPPAPRPRTQSTYQLKLEARIPVTNPSYLPRASTIAGDLRVLFYKTQAGGAHIKTVQLRRAPPRCCTWRWTRQTCRPTTF